MVPTEILVIFVLVLLNGFFALSEMALVSSRRSRLQSRAEQGSRGARIALALLEDSTSFLSAVQIGITLIGIVTGVYSGATLAAQLDDVIAAWGIPMAYAEEIAFTGIVVVVTFVTLILGELVPKRIALENAEGLAILVAPVMRGFSVAMTPFVWLLRGSVDVLLKLVPVPAASQKSVTEDDVRAMIAEGTRSGVFLASEKRLIEGVLALADQRVGAVMVPRQDIIWLDLDEPLPQLWQEAKESGHARFLAAHGSLEQLAGVLTLANLSEALRRGSLDPERDLMPALHVPESITVMQMLDQFRRSSTHLAVVIDEYGDVEGVATPIDILKAIAGELPDVGSRERPEIVTREDGSLLIDGHLPIDEMQRALGRRDMLSVDYHTAAGFVLARFGRIPKSGDVVTWRGLRFEIVDMDGKRIDKLLAARTG
ncbi:MAG: hemolysin family protein [Steroidobacteraceae bacterium]